MGDVGIRIQRYVANLHDNLVKANRETLSTNELLEYLEKSCAIVSKLKPLLAKKLSGENYYALSSTEVVNRVHNPEDSVLCGECRFLIDEKQSVCPFCDSQFLDPEQVESIPEIAPVTAKSLLPGPAESKKRGRRGGYSKSTRTAKKLINWIRKKELAKGIPYTAEQLSEMKTNDIRTIASLFKEYTVEKYRHFRKEDYIRFILSLQSESIDAGPCPVNCFPNT